MSAHGLPLSSLCLKAVHNSYGSAKRTLAAQLAWDADHPYRAGCCGLELDVFQKEGGATWCVRHGEPYTSVWSAQLTTYLGKLNAWSRDAGGDHPPIFVHFDLKNSPGSHADFVSEFDAYVRCALADCTFYTPGDMLRGRRTLLEAALADGWPTDREVWGRIICCLSGNEDERTKQYLATSLPSRLCFADRNVSRTITSGTLRPEDEPNRIIYNFRYDKLGALQRLIDPKYRRALLFRAYEVNDEDTWHRAVQLGVNIVATDQVFVTRWAGGRRSTPMWPLPRGG